MSELERVAAAVDNALEQLENTIGYSEYPDPKDEIVGAIAVAVQAVNRAIQADDGEDDEWRKRIEKWIGKLKQLLHNAAKETRAQRISITVGFPWNVSASLEWDTLVQ